MDNEKDIIEENFDKLPERFKELVLDSDVDDAVVEIGKKYNLTDEQVEILNGEVFALLIGETTGKDFIEEIKNELKTDQKTAEDIFVDCSLVILDPIMDKFYYKNDPEGDSEERNNIKLSPIDEREIEKEVDEQLEIYQALNINQPPIKLKPADENRTLDIEPPEVTRKRILDGIENPKTIGAMIQERKDRNLIEEKMGNSFSLPKTETDYSIDIKKEEKKEEVKRVTVDPYRIKPE